MEVLSQEVVGFRTGVTYTLAEGVAVKKPNEKMLSYMQEYLDDMIAISEESIASAIATLTEQGKLVAEGAGALPVAAVLEGLIPEKKLALVISGETSTFPLYRMCLQARFESGTRTNGEVSH